MITKLMNENSDMNNSLIELKSSINLLTELAVSYQLRIKDFFSDLETILDIAFSDY